MEHKRDFAPMDIAPDLPFYGPIMPDPVPPPAGRKAFWRAAFLAAGIEQEDDDPEFATDVWVEKKFRFSGKNLFLTYSQSNLTPEIIWRFFSEGINL